MNGGFDGTGAQRLPRRYFSDAELKFLSQHFNALGCCSREALLASLKVKDLNWPPHDNDVLDALHALEREGKLDLLLNAVVEHFSENPTPDLAAFARSVGLRLKGAPTLAIANFYDLPHDPVAADTARSFTRDMLKGWIVRIEKSGAPIAHGVLVGPDLVLTCRHAIDSTDDAGSLDVTMAVDGARQRFGLSQSDPFAFGVDRFASLDAVFLRLQRRSATRTSYAPNGLARGWLSLRRSVPVAEEADCSLWVYSGDANTAGDWAIVARGWSSMRPARDGLRLVHRCETAPGDSGGLLVDRAFYPVGFHTDVREVVASGDDAVGRLDHDVGEGERRAIRFAMLWRHIVDQGEGLCREFMPYHPLWHQRQTIVTTCHDDQSAPIFDRDAFQGIVHTFGAMEPDRQGAVVLVNGASGSGRSFSKKIVEAIVARWGQPVALVDAAELGFNRADVCTYVARSLNAAGVVDAEITLEDILGIAPDIDAVGYQFSADAYAAKLDAPKISNDADRLEGLGDTFGVRSNPQPREVKILAENLAGAVQRIFARGADKPRRSWIVFDNVAAPYVTEEVRQLLQWLAIALSDLPSVTLVVIGADEEGAAFRPRPGGENGPQKLCAFDTVYRPNQNDLENFFVAAWHQRGIIKRRVDAIVAAESVLSAARGLEGRLYLDALVSGAKHIMEW